MENSKAPGGAGCVVSLSGGMDSATLLAHVRKSLIREQILAVGFDYGSKHGPHERVAARAVASYYDVPFWEFDLRGVMSTFRSNLMAAAPGKVPEGHYQEETMRLTVVPGRNLIFTSILAGVAQSEGFGRVALGVHAGDHHIYPDCRPDWLEAVRTAVLLGSEGRVALFAPFSRKTKADILKIGLELGVPYHLTRTCYTDGEVACGKCGSCQERRSAFLEAGIEDQIPYLYSGPLSLKLMN